MAESKLHLSSLIELRGASMAHWMGPFKSVLNGISIGEHTVLVLTALLIAFSRRSLLSELWLGLGSSLVIVAAGVDVLKPFSETVLDRHDLSGRLVQEIVDLGLDFRIRLPVVLIQLDLGHSVLNLLNQLSESKLSGLALIIVRNLLRFLDLALLQVNALFLNSRFSGLLLSSHLIDLSSHLIQVLIENLDDFILVVLVDEIEEALDGRIIELVRQLLDGVINILCLEGFLEFVKAAFVAQDSLDFLGILLRNLLSILILLSLVDRVERNAEVSEQSVGSNDLLLLRIDIGRGALLSRRLLLVEF